MNRSSEVVIKVHVGAARNFIQETHLEELVDYFEHEVFREEVIESRAHPLVNRIEGQTASRVSQLLCDEVAKLVSLVSDLVHVLISTLLEDIEESTLFKLVYTLLQKLSWLLLSILAKAELSLSFCDKFAVRKNFFNVQSLLSARWTCSFSSRHLHCRILLLRCVFCRVRFFEE